MTLPGPFVDRFRTLWAGRLIDRVTVTRVTDHGTLNAATSTYDAPTVATVLDGSAPPANALIRRKAGALVADGGGVEAQRVYTVFVAYDSAAYRIGDTITVEASAYNAELVGETLRVFGLDLDAYDTVVGLDAVLDEGTGRLDAG